MPRAVRAGFETYWTTFGQGPRAAVMIHCSLASSAAWGGLAKHLSGALSMTAFDLPGHGRSAEWDDRGEIQEVSARIAGTFCERPTDLIGHSFGATVALRLAVERPGLVRTLTLIEPVFFAVARRDRPDLGRRFEADQAAFMAARATGDHRAAARAFTALWGEGTEWGDIPPEQQARLAEQMPLVAAADGVLCDDTAGLLADGVLQGVAQPVLLLEGSRSPRIITHVVSGLAARLPHAARGMIIGAGHMAPVTHPAQVSTEILRFYLRGGVA